MNEIQLTLELSEINQILDALGNQPYAQVFQLINKIQAQAEQQLQQGSMPEPLANDDSDEQAAQAG